MKTGFWKTLCCCMVAAASSQALANSACDANGSLTIIFATDDGLYEETHGPENTMTST